MNRPQWTACVVLAMLFAPVALFAAENDSKLDPAQPYQAARRSPVTYRVDFSVVVTAPNQTKTLKVWMPIPQSDAAQEIAESELRTFPLEVKPRLGVEPEFGNKFAYFEFDHPQGAQIIRHRFQITVWEQHWDVDPKKVLAVRGWPDAFQPYLRSEGQAIVINDNVTRRLGDILPQRTNSYQDMSAVMKWVDSHFTYDVARASLQASSLRALEQTCGDCGEYHGFCAAMGRAIGYPTRMTYGIHTFPKNSPSHCKLEIFLPPYGWVSFDVSETQKLAAAIRKETSLSEVERQTLIAAAVRRLDRGFRDNTWFLLTRGSDYQLVPPASRRVAVVRTIYAEADGQPLPEPNPSAADRKEFSWMTSHSYTPDKNVTYPFKDWRTLSPEAN